MLCLLCVRVWGQRRKANMGSNNVCSPHQVQANLCYALTQFDLIFSLVAIFSHHFLLAFVRLQLLSLHGPARSGKPHLLSK
jgi:hypothetical protein